MIKKNYKHIAGLTLIEILIGVIVSSLMMAAIYSTYSIVNRTYNQVVDKAKISQSSRDLVGLLMRDTRMAGFKYYLGNNNLNLPKESYLEFKSGTSDIRESHDPIIIVKNHLGFNKNNENPSVANSADKVCCDIIHIVFDDFNQNNDSQPYLRYKVSYFAEKNDVDSNDVDEETYSVYKSKALFKQDIGINSGDWTYGCDDCYERELIKDNIVDMEFVAFDKDGKILLPPPNPSTLAGRTNLYKVRSVDIRIAFRSDKKFFNNVIDRSLPGIQRTIADAMPSFSTRYLRENIVVTVHTRNIVSGGNF